jgi:hypothetical protein
MKLMDLFKIAASRSRRERRLSTRSFEQKLTQDECDELKRDIVYRLDNEDYTCRLPRLPVQPKPRVRHKLRRYVRCKDGFVYWVYQ